uniref:ATP synthase subunit a n=1 Tax=Nomada flavoguttata TaxID=601529 RepID=A0A0S2LSS0_9HYME|nr:ATP synthase F0 subunit 6 [Nomada flavoguttata]
MKLNMMMSLFESFDPMVNMTFSLNWLMMFIPMLLCMYMYWLIPSRINMLFIKMVNLLFKEFKLISSKKYESNILIFMSLFFYIMLLNLLSLMPYIFTITSQMSFNLSLSLSLWFSFIMYSLYKMPKNFFIHLVPLNTPFMLMHFMVLIELISNFIRPWTLSIRLTANLIAGHLLLILLGSFMNNFIMIIPLMIIPQNLLLILEISMSLIQAYVFSILSILYFSESKM